MKLLLVSESGEVLSTIEKIDKYDLEKPFARAALIDEIKEAIENSVDDD